MKKFVLEFLRRGLVVAAFGPVVLAVVYGVLGAAGVLESLTPAEVCRGILTITLLSFIAGGMTAVYKLERLPLLSAALIHAGVLYLDYLLIYLVNGWIRRSLTVIGIFTLCFVVGYALIWLGIYVGTRAKTEQLNRKLRDAAR